jgi:hypothetical protein
LVVEEVVSPGQGEAFEENSSDVLLMWIYWVPVLLAFAGLCAWQLVELGSQVFAAAPVAAVTFLLVEDFWALLYRCQRMGVNSFGYLRLVTAGFIVLLPLLIGMNAAIEVALRAHSLRDVPGGFFNALWWAMGIAALGIFGVAVGVRVIRRRRWPESPPRWPGLRSPRKDLLVEVSQLFAVYQFVIIPAALLRYGMQGAAAYHTAQIALGKKPPGLPVDSYLAVSFGFVSLAGVALALGINHAMSRVRDADQWARSVDQSLPEHKVPCRLGDHWSRQALGIGVLGLSLAAWVLWGLMSSVL